MRLGGESEHPEPGPQACRKSARGVEDRAWLGARRIQIKANPTYAHCFPRQKPFLAWSAPRRFPDKVRARPPLAPVDQSPQRTAQARSAARLDRQQGQIDSTALLALIIVNVALIRLKLKEARPPEGAFLRPLRVPVGGVLAR